MMVVSGFVPMGGTSAEGKKFYKKTKEIYASMWAKVWPPRTESEWLLADTHTQTPSRENPTELDSVNHMKSPTASSKMRLGRKAPECRDHEPHSGSPSFAPINHHCWGFHSFSCVLHVSSLYNSLGWSSLPKNSIGGHQDSHRPTLQLSSVRRETSSKGDLWKLHALEPSPVKPSCYIPYFLLCRHRKS